MSALYAKCHDLLKREGVFRAPNLLIKRLWRLFYRKRTLVLYNADLTQQEWWHETGLPPLHKPKINLSLRRATLDDMGRFAEVVDKRELKKIEHWFQEGHVCFVALHNEKIVYYLWACFNESYYASEIKMSINLSKRDFFVHDVVTAPGYRGHNIHQAVISMLLTYCIERNCTHLYSLVLPETFRAFQIMYKRAKFGTIRPIQGITFTQIFGIKRHNIVDLKGGGHSCWCTEKGIP